MVIYVIVFVVLLATHIAAFLAGVRHARLVNAETAALKKAASSVAGAVKKL